MLEDTELTSLSAIPVPLPPVAEHQVFSPDQWTIFLSICEIFIPSISSSNLGQSKYIHARNVVRELLPKSADEALADTYLAETIANNPGFKEATRRRFVAFIPPAQAKGLAFLLSALNTRTGSYLMTGSTSPIHTSPLATRTRIVLAWADSYIGPLRALYQACESLTKTTWLVQSTTFHKVIDYPKVPRNIERHDSYKFEFIDFSNHDPHTTVEVKADIVIVGSGCGSGVVADYLARNLSQLDRKPRILVLEKGYHFPSTHFPMDQSSAGTHMQEAGGGLLADDGSIGIVAGSVFGGGGMINWSASLQPQNFVREHWAKQTGSTFFTSAEFQGYLDEVCDRMGVCRAHDLAGLAKIEHNYANSALLESARCLGLAAEVVPQNTAGKPHYCGRCHYGCAAATKQGPANLWLPAAADNGVEFIEGCLVNKIIWDETAPSSQPKRAIGLSATWTSRDRANSRSLNIQANRMVLSSGTLNTPLILHRSGLTPEVNKHIGSNLHLHPVMFTRGTYDDRVDPWDGAILTSAMTSLENFSGSGHGCKIEINLGTPDMAGTILPFRPQLSLNGISESNGNDEEVALRTALDYKMRMARQGHSFTFIAIQRDHADKANSGRSYVYNDTDDARLIKVKYTPSIKDRESLLEGVITSARMHYVMGAKIIEISSPHIELFERSSAQDDTSFEDWIADVKQKGISALDTRTNRLGSAHQMGTCRMSTTPAGGAVNIKGKVWGTGNVFVADASVFPSASGVNPMVSTMGLSLHIAKAIVQDFKDSEAVIR